MALLELHGVCKSYCDRSGETQVLRGVDLSLEQGELAAVTGPSGCGKSTLLHLIGALDEPTSGSIILEGRDLRTLSAGARAALRNARMGFVYQFHHLLGDFSALENVMMPQLIGGTSRAAARSSARQLLERVGLGPQLRLRPAELSGGQRQRVAIARALSCRPPLVLADEPTGNLDEEQARSVFSLFCELVREHATTVVLVTHDAGLAAQVDRRFCLRSGVIA